MLIGDDYMSRHNNVPVVSTFPIHPEILQAAGVAPLPARSTHSLARSAGQLPDASGAAGHGLLEMRETHRFRNTAGVGSRGFWPGAGLGSALTSDAGHLRGRNGGMP